MVAATTQVEWLSVVTCQLTARWTARMLIKLAVSRMLSVMLAMLTAMQRDRTLLRRARYCSIVATRRVVMFKPGDAAWRRCARGAKDATANAAQMRAGVDTDKLLL